MQNQNMENTVSLGTLALELKVNKSLLSYYYSQGLLIPIATVGRMNVFAKKETLAVIKKIREYKKSGKTLQEIKSLVA